MQAYSEYLIEETYVFGLSFSLHIYMLTGSAKFERNQPL